MPDSSRRTQPAVQASSPTSRESVSVGAGRGAVDDSVKDRRRATPGSVVATASDTIDPEESVEGGSVPWFLFPVVAVGLLFSAAALGFGLWGVWDQLPAALTAPPVDQVAGPSGAERQRSSAAELGLPVFFRNRLGMDFAWCPPGEFEMGTTETDPMYRPQEHPHRVRLTRGFYVSQYEVTREQFQQLMPNQARAMEVVGLPANNVSWNDAVEFCVRLTLQEAGHGYEYRLPTEAEWEYACRADTKTPWHFGTEAKDLSRYGWVRSGAREELQAVGQLLPNPWGFYDMYGNVWEWCHDHYDSYPVDELTIDPRVSRPGRDRVRRGGSVGRYPLETTSSGRNSLKPTQRDPETGFRVVLAILDQSIEEPPTERTP